jgi:hypothetical protein
VDVVEVGVAAGREGAQEVQGRGRLVVGLDQPLRVRGARGLVEGLAVDVVAPVGGQGDPVHRLGRLRARLGELAGDAADLHDGLSPGEGQDHRHLQDQAEGVADVVGRELLEALGAVAALQQEGLAVGDLAQEALQPPRLAGEDQRRHAAQGGLGALQRVGIGIVRRDVPGGSVAPAGGGPTLGHGRLFEFGAPV